MEKYQGKQKDGKCMPVASNQKMSEYLKEIGTICGINKKLTFYIARRIFATLMITKGMPIESIAKMLGHSDLKTTQIYMLGYLIRKY